MADLTGQQLKDSYQNLVTIDATIESNPTSGQLENGLGNPITALGIGTDNPSTKLQVTDGYISTYHNINANTAGYGIQFFTNAGGSKNTIATIQPIQVGTTRSGSLLFSTSDNGAPTERLRIHSSGDISFRDGSNNEAFYWDASTARLGLGTQTPSAGLHVESSDANVAYFIRPSSGPSVRIGSSTTDNAVIGYTVSGDFARFGHDSATNAIAVNSSGNVGIGATSISSGFRTEIAGGDFRVGDTQGEDAVEIGWSAGGSQGFVQAYDRGDSAFRDLMLNASLLINPSGNVGIGETNPSSKLSIKGAQAAIDITRGTSGDSKWGFSSDAVNLYIAELSTGVTDYVMTLQETTGNVGIGTTSPDSILEIAGTTPTLTIDDTRAGSWVSGDKLGTVSFRTSDGSGAGAREIGFIHIENEQAGTNTTMSGAMVFGSSAYNASATERMRIDSSGNVLVGKTASGLATTGFQAIKSGQSAFVSDGDRSLILNRKTSDGSILEFRKDESEVGSIGTEGGDMAIGNGDAGLQFIDGTQSVRPFNMTTNARIDAQVDLGMSSTRFKDLYLSGTSYIDGAIEQTSRAKTITFSKSISDNVATDIAHHSLTPSASTTMVTIVISASGGYAVETYRYLWNTRAHGSGNNRSVVSLTGADLGSVNAGVVAIGTVTATAVLDTTEKFRLTVDLTGASTCDVYVKMESVGSNVSDLTSL